MKKILILTPRFPYPVIGGDRLRIYKICESLSKYYDLTLLSLCDSKHEMEINVSDNIFKKIYRVYLSKTQSIINTLLAVPTRTPLQVAYYKSRDFRKKLDELLPENDIVLAHLIRTGDYVKNKHYPKIIEMTDAISLNYKRVSQHNVKGIRGLIYRAEQRRLECYEKQMVNHFDLLSFVSDVDKNYLFRNYNHVRVYSNGVDTTALSFLKRVPLQKKEINLVFIGNMYSLQNLDAVLWFSKKILPRLLVKGKKIQLLVIGKIKDTDKKNLLKFPNVKVSGAVNSVVEASKQGDIGICPIRLGAGVQNKILEYMALGLPCITSLVGYEGIGAKENKEVLLAETLEEYNLAINKLVYDMDFYDFIANNARFFVEHNYSWSTKLEPMMTDISKLIEK